MTCADGDMLLREGLLGYIPAERTRRALDVRFRVPMSEREKTYCFLAHTSENRRSYCSNPNPSDMESEPFRAFSRTLRFSLVCARRQYSVARPKRYEARELFALWPTISHVYPGVEVQWPALPSSFSGSYSKPQLIE
jgi:hypothetical protein